MATEDLGDLGDYILELTAPIGPCRLRRMFGGYGLYRGAVMFGLIADGILHFKTDEANRPDYEAAGMLPFSYETKHGRRVAMSYHRVPDTLFDEPEAFLDFARKALAAAERKKAAPKPRSRAAGPTTERRVPRRAPG